jgi:hypothetical protein
LPFPFIQIIRLFIAIYSIVENCAVNIQAQTDSDRLYNRMVTGLYRVAQHDTVRKSEMSWMISHTIAATPGTKATNSTKAQLTARRNNRKRRASPRHVAPSPTLDGPRQTLYGTAAAPAPSASRKRAFQPPSPSIDSEPTTSALSIASVPGAPRTNSYPARPSFYTPRDALLAIMSTRRAALSVDQQAGLPRTVPCRH